VIKSLNFTGGYKSLCTISTSEIKFVVNNNFQSTCFWALATNLRFYLGPNVYHQRPTGRGGKSPGYCQSKKLQNEQPSPSPSPSTIAPVAGSMAWATQLHTVMQQHAWAAAVQAPGVKNMRLE